MGIICPGGQEVGDRKSGDQMGSGPNASQPQAVVSANYLKINIINKTFVVSKIASSLKITKLSLDKISECNQGPDILRL